MTHCVAHPSISARPNGCRYNDFELGAAEHKLPLLYVVAPDWLLRRNPRWREGLAANQRRLVTARCLHPLTRTLTSPYIPPHTLTLPYIHSRTPSHPLHLLILPGTPLQVRDIYRTMRVLLSWPDAPPGASTPSLLEPVPEGRTCAEAGIPDTYCACRNPEAQRRFSAVVEAARGGPMPVSAGAARSAVKVSQGT